MPVYAELEPHVRPGPMQIRSLRKPDGLKALRLRGLGCQCQGFEAWDFAGCGSGLGFEVSSHALWIGGVHPCRSIGLGLFGCWGAGVWGLNA